MRLEWMLAWLCLQPAALAGSGPGGQIGQTIRDESGNVFMQEVLPARPAHAQASPGQWTNGAPARSPGRNYPQLDFSNLGVKVDPYGNIIPLLNNGSPGTVQPFYSRTTVMQEIPYAYYYYPYGSVPYFYPAGPFYRPYGSRPYAYPGTACLPQYYGASPPVLGLGLSFGRGFPGRPYGPFSAPRLGGYMWLPGVTQFQGTSTIRPLFSSRFSF